uniref:Uncharacterized protein n=1 Tax=Gopherus evgoodei TaxID=1825980 RepID=A0A8C4XWN8_9SAUR
MRLYIGQSCVPVCIIILVFPFLLSVLFYTHLYNLLYSDWRDLLHLQLMFKDCVEFARYHKNHTAFQVQAQGKPIPAHKEKRTWFCTVSPGSLGLLYWAGALSKDSRGCHLSLWNEAHRSQGENTLAIPSC